MSTSPAPRWPLCPEGHPMRPCHATATGDICRVCDINVLSSQDVMREHRTQEQGGETPEGSYGEHARMIGEWRGREAEANACDIIVGELRLDGHMLVSLPSGATWQTDEVSGPLLADAGAELSACGMRVILPARAAYHVRLVLPPTGLGAQLHVQRLGDDDVGPPIDGAMFSRVGHTDAEVRETVRRLCDTREITASLQNILDAVLRRIENEQIEGVMKEMERYGREVGADMSRNGFRRSGA